MIRRAERISALLQKEISELLQEQINDPRLNSIASLISITHVSTSADLQQAKIYISILGQKNNTSEILKGFKAAAGFFRRELSHRLPLKHVPELTFCFDDSIERGSNMLQLIEQVATEDELKRNS